MMMMMMMMLVVPILRVMTIVAMMMMILQMLMFVTTRMKLTAKNDDGVDGVRNIDAHSNCGVEDGDTNHYEILMSTTINGVILLTLLLIG
jgi:hypothetical protein